MLGGSMLTRRRIFIGGVATVICAPAIVRADSLMPIRAHRSDAACPRGICRTPAIPLHGTAFEERMDYRTRTDVRRHFPKRGATPSHLCPNARIASVNPPGWRLGFFAAQNSYACASAPSKARSHSAPHVGRRD